MHSTIKPCMRQYVRRHAQMVIAEIDGSVAAGPYNREWATGLNLGC